MHWTQVSNDDDNFPDVPTGGPGENQPDLDLTKERTHSGPILSTSHP